jgi:hypothetical protein
MIKISIPGLSPVPNLAAILKWDSVGSIKLERFYSSWSPLGPRAGNK